jgi:hypothetical protein
MKALRDKLVPIVFLGAWFLVSAYTLNALRTLQFLQLPQMEAPAVVITP